MNLLLLIIVSCVLAAIPIASFFIDKSVNEKFVF